MPRQTGKTESKKDAEETRPPTEEKPFISKNKKKSFKKQDRDEVRMTEHRAKTSEKTAQETKEALFDKLFFGYRNVTEAMKNITIQQIKRTIILPISLRTAGFMIRGLIAKFQRLKVVDENELLPLTNALYRITLHQIDYKIEEAMIMQHPRNLLRNAFEDTYLSSDFRRALDLMGAGFAPLINYISAIGFVKTTNKLYLPRHPKILTTQCSPFYTRASNLRLTVQMLSDANIALGLKQFYHDHCPIPGAKWSVTSRRTRNGVDIPANIILTNPDDIIPLNYGILQMRDDIAMVSAAVEKIARKYPKYISTGGIDWKAQGSISQIVSNYGADLRCPNWPIIGTIPNVHGEHSDFWTPDYLSEPEAYMGVVYLLGEILPCFAVPDCASYRNRYTASDEINLDYASVLQNLIN